MAQRRMFSLKIVDTDAFLEMPITAQALYFHLAMRADDDGFVNNPKRIMRTVGTNEDDIKVLLTKRFILSFESGIIVIKHWRVHNLIQGDRYTETEYKNEKESLFLNENGSYTDRDTGEKLPLTDKPGWQKKRTEAMRESNLPQSFSYKIRQAFWGKLCPICKVEMREKIVDEIRYGEKNSPAPTIQHLIPISKGGKHEIGNIAVICGNCNYSIKDTETGKLNSEEVAEVWKQIGNKSGTQVRIGKDRLGKVSIKEGVNKFTPPSLSDVKAYCTERNNSVDPEKFINFYESKGWFIGKNKMKDWRAAVRTWEKGDAINNKEEKPIIPSYAKKWIK